MMNTWSTTLPAGKGWYWWRPGADTDKMFKKMPAGIYFLELTGLGEEKTMHLALPRDRNRYPAKWMGGEWAGPIPEPQTPTPDKE